MNQLEKEVLEFLEALYGCAHVDYFDDTIYLSDEETGKGYKVSIEVTN